MPKWEELVLSEIERTWQPGETFTRQEWLVHSMPAFKDSRPDIATHEMTAQRALQNLRDQGRVEFLGNGMYRLPPVSAKAAVSTDDKVRRGLIAQTCYRVLADGATPLRAGEVFAGVEDLVSFTPRELSLNDSNQVRWRTAANMALSWSTFGGWLDRDEVGRYSLTQSGAEALENLTADALWTQIQRRYYDAKRDAPTTEVGWDAFLHWAHELTVVIDLASEERDYKVEAAKKWRAAAQACIDSDDDWTDRLKQALGAGNLVNPFSQTWLRNRMVDHPHEVREAVAHLFTAEDVVPAVEIFGERLGSWGEYVSPGDRVVFASCVLLGASPGQYAPYQPALGKGWAAAVGAEPGTTPGERYAALLALCDELVERWEGAHATVTDRLDAQGLAWAVLKWGAPVTWPPLKQAELEHWRTGAEGPVTVERGAAERPEMEAGAWEVLCAGLRGETSALVPGVQSWTAETAEDLLARLDGGNPDLGFAERFVQQLEGASDAVRTLAAELSYLRDAPRHDVLASTKSVRLTQVLPPSTASTVPERLIAALSAEGAFAGGQGYNTRGGEHLRWLCRFVVHWCQQPGDVTDLALRDPVTFRKVTAGVPKDSPSIRYVLEHIAWPGYFPAIVSVAHRRKIRDGLFSDVGTPSGNTDEEITRDLVALRILHQRKTKAFPSWYQPPYVARWRPDAHTELRAWLVRPDEESDVARWLAEGFVALRDAGLALREGQTLAEVRALVDAANPDLAPSQRSELAAAFHLFIDGIQDDDRIVALVDESLVVGTADGTAPDAGASLVRRPVLWDATQHPLDSLPARVVSALEQEGHVVDLTNVLTLLPAMTPMDPGPKPGPVAPEAPVTRVLLPAVSTNLARDLYMPRENLQELVDLLNRRRQLVVYGPPGTGKTFVTKRLAEQLAGSTDPSRVRLVQFHPSYAYEDFFEGFRPTEVGGQAHFSLQDGPLKLMTLEARKKENADKAFVLIIDELNRANLAKVFGELYFLLEYREESVRLQYRPETPFSLPDNLFIIGTMNTADRSIALVDAAIRRRFPFYEMHPQRPPVQGVLAEYAKSKNITDDRVALLAELNAAMGQLPGDDLHIGPSYLMRDWLTEPGALEMVWRYDILPLLHEHFYSRKEPELIDGEFGIEALRKRIMSRSSRAANQVVVDGSSEDSAVPPAGDA